MGNQILSSNPPIQNAFGYLSQVLRMVLISAHLSEVRLALTLLKTMQTLLPNKTSLKFDTLGYNKLLHNWFTKFS